MLARNVARFDDVGNCSSLSFRIANASANFPPRARRKAATSSGGCVWGIVWALRGGGGGMGAGARTRGGGGAARAGRKKTAGRGFMAQLYALVPRPAISILPTLRIPDGGLAQVNYRSRTR